MRRRQLKIASHQRITVLRPEERQLNEPSNQPLPFSPHKKCCVVESLAKEVGLQVTVTSPAANLYYGGLDEDTKQLVLAFNNK